MKYSFFPHYNQLDAMDCGPTCLRMVAKYYGKSISLDYLRNKAKYGKLGVSMLGLAEAPPQTQYFAELLISQYNFGRVTTGQQVRLKLQAYPFEQFGALQGRIEAIQQASTDSGFFARVRLPDSLVTQYHQPIFFREGLTAEAEIITDNLNLLQRLYYNAVRSLKR